MCATVAALSIIVAIPAVAWDETGPEVTRKDSRDTIIEKVTPVKENGLWGFINSKGKFTIKPVYEAVGEPMSFTLKGETLSVIPVKSNGKWGLVNHKGKEITAPVYDEFTPLFYRKGDLGWYALSNGLLDFIYAENGKPNRLSGSGYHDLRLIDDGLFVFEGNELQVISPGINKLEINRECGDFFLVKSRNSYPKWVDKRPNFDVYTHFKNKSYDGNNTLSVLQREGNDSCFILVDYDGDNYYDKKKYTRLNDKKYTEIHGLDEEKPKFLRLVDTDGKTEIFDLKNGNFYGSFDDKHIVGSEGDLFTYKDSPESNLIGLMMKDGTAITKPIYETITLGDKSTIVGKDGKFGIISNSGETILPIQYNSIKRIGSENYQVSNDNGVGVFSASLGKMKLEPGYYTAIGDRILNGAAVWVQKGNKWGAATADLSREIVPPVYDDNSLEVGNTRLKLFHVYKNGTVGVINFDGKTIVPTGKYTGIKGYDLDGICVLKGKKEGLVDFKTGRQIIPPVHDYVSAKGNGNYMATDMTPSGYTLIVYNGNGAVINRRTFTNSQQMLPAYYMRDWLGNMPMTYDFRF